MKPISSSPTQYLFEYNRQGLSSIKNVLWSGVFAIPLLSLLDYIFFQPAWFSLLIIRLSITLFILTICNYVEGKKLNSRISLFVIMFVNSAFYSFLCAAAAEASKLPYFLIFAAVVFLQNSTIFVHPKISILYCLLCYTMLALAFALLNSSLDKNLTWTIENGGSAFLIITLSSCIISYARYQITLRNITKEATIVRSNQDFAGQNEEITEQRLLLENKNRQLQKTTEDLNKTLNVVLHDVRNFAGVVQGAVQLIHEDGNNLTAEQKSTLNIIQLANNRLNQFTQRISETGNIPKESTKLYYSTFDMNEALGKVVDTLRNTINAKNISLYYTTDNQQKLRVTLDPILTERLLFKLLSNIIRFAQNDSDLEISSHQNEHYAVIEIEDKGAPIGIDRLNTMFNKLVSLPQGHWNGDQQGLGFSIARELAEQMNGTINYESNEEIGNYYRIQFTIV